MTKSDQIRALYRRGEGLSIREIAEIVGSNPAYVRVVARQRKGCGMPAAGRAWIANGGNATTILESFREGGAAQAHSIGLRTARDIGVHAMNRDEQILRLYNGRRSAHEVAKIVGCTSADVRRVVRQRHKKLYYLANRERLNACQQKWREEHREWRLARQRAYDSRRRAATRQSLENQQS
jgi:hypothetical protein